MRQRFKPNITSRGTRSSRTSNSSTSSSTTKPNSSNEKSINDNNERQDNEPFIPPNSSKTIEDSVCEENETIEETNEVLVVETTTEKDIQKAAELKSSKVSNDKKTTSRRSRIKPVVTPAPRRRNTAKTKEVNDNVERTAHDECSAENSIEKDNSQQKQNAETNIETTMLPPDVSPNTTPAEITTTVESQTSVVESTDDGKTQLTGSSLSRRRRATPKICIPPRKKRAASISNDSDSADKSCEMPTENPQPQDDDEDVEKEIPETDVSSKPSKRQKIQEEVVEEDISLIEVTVQTGEKQDSTIHNDEEQDDIDNEQPQTNKKSQLKGKKKRIPIRKPKEMLDPSKMTLQDLIYFNPKENFMKSSSDAKHKKIVQQKQKAGQSTEDAMEVDDANTENQSNNQQTIDRTEGGDESNVCAPQVKIAADGSIIVDEESLLIRSPTHSTLEDTDIVYEDANAVNYDFYGKGVKRTRWSMPETLKFYKALSQVGTDFQLMVPLFPMRSRKELKAKFKREEKMNYHLIDKVLVHHTPISLEMFLKAEDDSKKTKKKGKKQTEPKDKDSSKETEDNSKNSKRKTRKQNTDANEKDHDKETELTVDNDS